MAQLLGRCDRPAVKATDFDDFPWDRSAVTAGFVFFSFEATVDALTSETI